MSSFRLLIRDAHPVSSSSTAMANRRSICEPRGYCGPFLNEEFYARIGDPLWAGMAECAHCCSTVKVQPELRKAAAAGLVFPSEALFAAV